MPTKGDHTKKAFTLTCMVILFLMGVSFIPPVRIGGLLIKRANILSDIIEYDDSAVLRPGSENILDTSFLALFDVASRREAAVEEGGDIPATDGAKAADATNNGADADSPMRGPVATVTERRLARPHVYNDTLVRIEDFSPGQAMMSRFYGALAYDSAERTVRIAVLGDSFIEGDIITADLREQLQLAYGGGGVGFVPFSTPLSKYRGTIKHTHDGWTNYNIIKHKSVPEEYKERFFISGMLSIPDEGASVTYRGVRFRSRIETAGSATLLFTNRGHSSLAVTINDSIQKTYTPPSGNSVGSIRIERDGISSLGISVADARGFIGYGVVLEDSVGVSVHNYSVRSNSGMALLGTNYEINSQIDALMRYDLVILQYGLNAMSPEVTDYGYYGRQLVRIIEYVKQCFPRSAILVMSVGDRSSLKNGTAVTMPAVKAMLGTQRAAAEATGVGFWNTFEAMGGDNSMPGFVEKKWAAKDYTHIGYSGGKYIAGQLVEYISAAVESIREQTSGDLAPLLDTGTKKAETGMLNTPSPHGIRQDGASDKPTHGEEAEAPYGAGENDGSRNEKRGTNGREDENSDAHTGIDAEAGNADSDRSGTPVIEYDGTGDEVVIEPLEITAVDGTRDGTVIEAVPDPVNRVDIDIPREIEVSGNIRNNDDPEIARSIGDIRDPEDAGNTGGTKTIGSTMTLTAPEVEGSPANNPSGV